MCLCVCARAHTRKYLLIIHVNTHEYTCALQKDWFRGSALGVFCHKSASFEKERESDMESEGANARVRRYGSRNAVFLLPSLSSLCSRLAITCMCV